MLFKEISILNEEFKVEEGMYVGVKNDKIEYIGKEEPREDFGEVYLGKNRILLPGFFNGHAHSPMALMRGYGENLTLQDWLNKRIFPFEDKIDGDAVYWGTMLCMAESLRFGIVSTSDMYYFAPYMVKAIEESGVKNNLSRSITNFTGEPFEKLESVKEMKTAIEQFHGCANGRILCDTSLHGEYTSDENTARGLAEFTKEAGLRMHVHVSETRLEHEECKRRHNGMTPVEYLETCGIFDSPAVAAHCVWIEKNDFEILKRRGVTVATNPVSNLKLASGICNVPKLLEKGINVSIGTDSVASNNNLNMLEEIKTMAVLGKVKNSNPTLITPSEVLRCATLGGAKAQGRNDCGAIKKGNKADFVVLRTDVANMHPAHSMVNNLVYAATPSEIVMTMVDGKVLYENGEYKTIDIEKTIFQTEAAISRVLGRL